MAHARRRLPDKEALFDRMRESIELPLLDSSLQPRIALAQVAVKDQQGVRSPDPK